MLDPQSCGKIWFRFKYSKSLFHLERYDHTGDPDHEVHNGSHVKVRLLWQAVKGVKVWL